MNFLISDSDLIKLDALINKLDVDTQEGFNKILGNLIPALRASVPQLECPPDKIMVDRNKWENTLYELYKESVEE